MNNLSKTLNNDSEYSKQKIEDNDTLIEAVEPKIINNEQKQNDILNQKVKVDTSKKMDQNSLNININYEEKEQITFYSALQEVTHQKHCLDKR